MTNAELLAEVRKPGKIEMPVLTGSGVVHLIIEKSDLIRELADAVPHADAPWALYGDNDGVRRLDVNN